MANWEKIKTANVLGLLIFVCSTAIIVLLFLFEIPDKNRDILNFCLVSYFNIALAGAVYYFYNFRKSEKKTEENEYHNDYVETQVNCQECPLQNKHVGNRPDDRG